MWCKDIWIFITTSSVTLGVGYICRQRKAWPATLHSPEHTQIAISTHQHELNRLSFNKRSIVKSFESQERIHFLLAIRSRLSLRPALQLISRQHILYILHARHQGHEILLKVGQRLGAILRGKGAWEMLLYVENLRQSHGTVQAGL
jgi:hypothetical protein